MLHEESGGAQALASTEHRISLGGEPELSHDARHDGDRCSKISLQMRGRSEEQRPLGDEIQELHGDARGRHAANSHRIEDLFEHLALIALRSRPEGHRSGREALRGGVLVERQRDRGPLSLEIEEEADLEAVRLSGHLRRPTQYARAAREHSAGAHRRRGREVAEGGRRGGGAERGRDRLALGLVRDELDVEEAQQESAAEEDEGAAGNAGAEEGGDIGHRAPSVLGGTNEERALRLAEKDAFVNVFFIKMAVICKKRRRLALFFILTFFFLPRNLF